MPLETTADIFVELDRAFHARFPPWKISGRLLPHITVLVDSSIRLCDAYASGHGLGTSSADALTAELANNLIGALQVLLARLENVITSRDLPRLTRMRELGIVVDYQLTPDAWRLKSLTDAMASVTCGSRAAQGLLADAVTECFGFVLVA